MEFKAIEALMYAAQGFTGTVERERVILKEAQASSDRLVALLEPFGVNAETMTMELEEALICVEADYARQGFINGFRMGVQLMRECTCPVTGGEAV